MIPCIFIECFLIEFRLLDDLISSIMIANCVSYMILYIYRFVFLVRHPSIILKKNS